MADVRRFAHGPRLIRLAGRVALVVAIGLAIAALWQAVRPEAPTTTERVQELQKGLRCPTCTAESIADSQSPVASGMRAELRDQVAAGRSDAEIRRWFEDRYGASVLLEPPARGATLVLWLVPSLVAAVGVAVWLIGAWRRRIPMEVATGEPEQQTPAPSTDRPDARGGRSLLTVGCVAALLLGLVVVTTADRLRDDLDSPARSDSDVETQSARDAELDALVEAVDRTPDQAAPWLALGRTLDDRGRTDEAEDAYRQALKIQPAHPAAMVRLAFVLVRTDRLGEATEVLQELLEDDPAQAEALLLLGTVQRETGNPRARRTLMRFLAVAPDHPATAEVKKILEGRSP